MARTLKNMTREELSKESGITLVTLGRYEREESSPSLNTVNKLALALKVELDVLLYWSENLLTCDDIFKFTISLFPNKYYASSYCYEFLSKLLDIKNFHNLFLNSTEIADYEKFSNYFLLSKTQTYNWMISIAIRSYLHDYYFLPHENADIDIIIDELIRGDKLVEQEIVVEKSTFYDYFKLSEENISIIEAFLETSEFIGETNKPKKNKNKLTIDTTGLSNEAINEIKSFVEFVKLRNKK